MGAGLIGTVAMTTAEYPTSTDHPSPAGLADWYGECAATIPVPGAVTLTNASGEPVTYYRRGGTGSHRPAMCWPRVARTR